MKTFINVGAVIGLSLVLSGCIDVTCPPSGRPALDENGDQVKVRLEEDVAAAQEQYCDYQGPDLTRNLQPVSLQPPGPTPTNLAPVVGGVAVAGAALGLGGNDGNPATATTGTN